MGIDRICERCHCPQLETCGMKDILGPKNVEQVFNTPREYLESFNGCFFYSCGNGQITAINALRKALREKQTGLIQFGTKDHKPHKNFGDLQGRFVMCRYPEYKDGTIVMTYNGEIIPLSLIRTSKLNR